MMCAGALGLMSTFMASEDDAELLTDKIWAGYGEGWAVVLRRQLL